jgi:RNA polymerase sigma-70 factor (ECF subfamily)
LTTGAGTHSSALTADRSPLSDSALVTAASKGDMKAFERLYRLHSGKVMGLCLRMTRRRDVAEDCVQQTFIRAWRSLAAFEGRSAFGTWLHRIAVNCSIDLIRCRPRREAAHDAADLDQFGGDERGDATRVSPERLMLSTEVQDAVAAAMYSLSQMERAAFVLRHFEGHSIEEISRALGLKTNAAKHSIFRAVKKMRVALEPLVSMD